MKPKITLKNKRVMKAIGKYASLGLSPGQIKDNLNSEFGIKTTRSTVGNIIQRFETRSKELIHSDKELAEIYKKSLFTIFDEIRNNLNSLITSKNLVESKLNLLKKDMPTNRMFNFTNEISKLIRTQNDTIRTMIDGLKRLETQTKETRVSTIRQAQVTISQLKDLEREGFITINKDFYTKNKFGMDDENE